MANENIKTIKELLLTGIDNQETIYFISSYQRGYKWREQQVEDLLNDFREFYDSQDEAKLYCLQPIMVRKEGNQYNVIDGQQRLTTLYLICKALGLNANCKIEYDTRKHSTKFLENPKTLLNSKDSESSDMDYYFMKAAFEVIEKWLNENNKRDDIITLFNAEKTQKHVGVIWYESKESEEEKLFQNVNSGKIPLNDAELIKARLLLSLNTESKDMQELRQIELAKEWDDMEYALQDDEFFSFLVKDKKSYDTRILLLFEVYFEVQSSDDKEKDKTHKEKDKNHAVFEFIQKAIAENKDGFWQEIKKIFLTFKSWYSNSATYHLIGFLLAQGESLTGLYKEAQSQTKSKFLEETIRGKIKVKIAGNEKGKECNKDNLQKKIETFQYGDNSNELKKVLLLFNILSYIDDSQLRFSFNIYKEKKWELEHIHAQQDSTSTIKSKNKAIEWLKAARQILNNAKELAGALNKEQRENIENALKKVEELLGNLESQDKDSDTQDKEEKKLSDDESKAFKECVDFLFTIFKGNDSNTIGNLTLLSKSDNISLSNDVFAMKQQRIKGFEQEGKFIPLCTRNVFLKYYTKEQKISQALFWSEEDSKDYQKEIIEKIQDYLFDSESKESK